MPRLALVLTIFGFCASGFVEVQGADTSPVKRPNIVLFVADDLGMQAGCYGNPVIHTPGVDRIAAEGTRYTRAYCTTASCSSSRAVILTGRFNHANRQYGLQHGYHHFQSDETERTLPVLMAEAGYRTCSIGKFHVAPEATYHFETYRNEGIQGARNPVRMAKNAKDWITEKDGRPFFLYFCTSDPHRGGGEDEGDFSNKPAGYPGITPVKYRPEDVIVPSWLPDLPEVRRDLAEYYQSVSRMDQGLNALLDALRDTGHWEDTVILVTSDNGPPFPGAKTTLYEPGVNLPLIVREPGSTAKGIVCDARVSFVDLTPTILDYAGALPNAKSQKPASEQKDSDRQKRAGEQRVTAKVPQIHGRSFRGTVGHNHVDGWDEIYASHTFHEVTMYYPMRVILRGKYKLIFNIASGLEYPFAADLYRSPTWQAALEKQPELYGRRTMHAFLHRPRFELYDLESDPDEIHNLAGDAQHADVFRDLQGRLKSWQERTDDPWVLKWDRE